MSDRKVGEVMVPPSRSARMPSSKRLVLVRENDMSNFVLRFHSSLMSVLKRTLMRSKLVDLTFFIVWM